MSEVAEPTDDGPHAGPLFTTGAVFSGLLALAPVLAWGLGTTSTTASPVLGVVIGVLLGAGVMLVVSRAERPGELVRVALLVLVGTATLVCGLQLLDVLDSGPPAGLVVTVPLVAAGLGVVVSTLRTGTGRGPEPADRPAGRGPVAAGLVLGLIAAVPPIITAEGLDDLLFAIPGVLLVVGLVAVLVVQRGHRLAASAAAVVGVAAAFLPTTALLSPVLGRRYRLGATQIGPAALLIGVVVVAVVVAAEMWRAGRSARGPSDRRG